MNVYKITAFVTCKETLDTKYFETLLKETLRKYYDLKVKTVVVKEEKDG
jgi:hypothetical protein